MLRIFSLEQAKDTILKRKSTGDHPVSEQQKARTVDVFGEYISPEQAVQRIISDIKIRGDEAISEWTRKLDGVDITPRNFTVEKNEIAEAYRNVPQETIKALKLAANRILAFHKKQPIHSWIDYEGGSMMGQKICPISRVGCYVPGGGAPLASTLLMTVLVAKAAGVPHVAVASPPDNKTGKIAPVTIVAADIAGVDVMYAIGGAQAIAALAFGTATIEPVDKICGPGNTFVMEAKKQVFGVVGIDSLPGPTETVIVADDTANPVWLAADLLAQAEHGGGTSILLTPSRSLADSVAHQVSQQAKTLSTFNAIEESFAKRSGAAITGDLDEAIRLADEFAPEHLCLSIAEPWKFVSRISRAGGVFVGEHSFEVLGDYVAGPSHTMPTGGTARFASPCNVMDFVRVMNIVGLGEGTAREISPAAEKLALSEGLEAHANAVRVRA